MPFSSADGEGMISRKIGLPPPKAQTKVDYRRQKGDEPGKKVMIEMSKPLLQ
jgi:hypothetical protein